MWVGQVRRYADSLNETNTRLISVDHITDLRAVVAESTARLRGLGAALVPEGPYDVPVHCP